jgi:hypothetical protein
MHCVAFTALGVPQTGQVFLLVTMASGEGVVCGVGVPSKSAVGLATWNGSSEEAETICGVVLFGAETDAVAGCVAGLDELRHPMFVVAINSANPNPKVKTVLPDMNYLQIQTCMPEGGCTHP